MLEVVVVRVLMVGTVGLLGFYFFFFLVVAVGYVWWWGGGPMGGWANLSGGCWREERVRWEKREKVIFILFYY